LSGMAFQAYGSIESLDGNTPEKRRRSPVRTDQKHSLSRAGEVESHRPEREIVRLAQEGNRWAIDELIRRYQRKVYGIAYHFASADKEDAKDLAQEAFFRVFRNIGKFNGRSSFHTWLYRVVVNTCVSAQKRRNRWRKLLIPWHCENRSCKDPDPGPEKYGTQGEDSDPELSFHLLLLIHEFPARLNSRIFPSRGSSARGRKSMVLMDGRYVALTAIFRGVAASTLGSVNRRTPSFIPASILPWSIICESVNCL